MHQDSTHPSSHDTDDLVANALKAATEFAGQDQSRTDHIVERAALAALDAHEELARLAVEETGRGVFEDKTVKNIFSCEHVTHSLRDLKTVGVVLRDELRGITHIAEPVGPICALTPVTNPTSTVVFKALIALKTRNPIIFASHPGAQECSARAARAVRDAAVEAGAPEHCVQWVEAPTKERTSALMRHPDIALILATGGNSKVREAYSSGKPAIGVGAGNVPVYVAPDADLGRAAHDIVMSTCFDNGMVCASEQAVVVEERSLLQVRAEFERLGAHFLSEEEKLKLEEFLFGPVEADGLRAARLDPVAVGKPARWIAEKAGLSVPDGTTVLLAQCDEVGEREPLTREKLCPILALLSADDTEHAFTLCTEVLQFNGLGHTAAIHTDDAELVERYGLRVPAMRVVANSPSSLGGIGDIYNSFTPSLTLGCGSQGGNSVSDNVSAVHLLNIKRIGRRQNNMQWYKVPPKIYFERNAIRYLADMPGIRRATVVTGRSHRFRDRLCTVLGTRDHSVRLQFIDDIEPDPDLATVRRGAAALHQFQPDTIIALGGGSVMDAAKIMWLMYERPEVEFDHARQKFLDIRKRAYTFPELGEKARLVAIPTTSGTGSEVTPFAVISDVEAARKYPLADYALTPSVAIVDPALVTDLPATVTADSGFDALTHATEAYLSVYANDFTDGQCLQAIELIFNNLEDCVLRGAAAPEAREKMHNASTLAGMAFANAFLGLVHAMAHTLGNTFHLPHGRANALLLPHVIRHNGTLTHKITPWPKATTYRGPERLQQIARVLGLPADTPAQGVESYARAVEDLRRRCGIPASLCEAGVDEAAFLEVLPRQVRNAHADQCAPANPRMPMLGEIRHLMLQAYYGADPAGDTPSTPPRGEPSPQRPSRPRSATTLPVDSDGRRETT